MSLSAAEKEKLLNAAMAMLGKDAFPRADQSLLWRFAKSRFSTIVGDLFWQVSLPAFRRTSKIVGVTVGDKSFGHLPSYVDVGSIASYEPQSVDFLLMSRIRAIYHEGEIYEDWMLIGPSLYVGFEPGTRLNLELVGDRPLDLIDLLGRDREWPADFRHWVVLNLAAWLALSVFKRLDLAASLWQSATEQRTRLIATANRSEPPAVFQTR